MLKLCVAGAVLAIGSAASGQVIGGSDMIGPGELSMLESWLGEGPLTLYNIFDKKAGDGKTAADFHAAADGQGRTISVMRDRSTGYTVGGYNPVSWDQSSSYSDAAGSFIFNFNLGMKLDPQSGYPGAFNYSAYGPTFGGGHDIGVVDYSLEGGYFYSYTYGPASVLDGSGGQGWYYSGRSFSDVETFTIGVPTPGGLALLGIGGLATARRRR